MYIGEDALSSLSTLLNSNKGIWSKYLILVDDNTLRYCLPVFMDSVKELEGAEVLEVDNGEQTKSLDICSQLWESLSELGADRSTLLINLGGGMISDLGGFVASAFKRGISFINVPTTLLAQVDASIGGKVGVNHKHLKNEIGFYKDPVSVYVSPVFLKSLDSRQIASGFAEVIKHALIADIKYWEYICDLSLEELYDDEYLLFRSIEIKNEIVKKDPLEENVRKLLNFGHTVGHAVESCFMENGKSILHGEAVAIGMICEAYLSHKKRKLDMEQLEEITSYIFSFFNLPKLDLNDILLLEKIKHDKKNSAGDINFTLLDSIGVSKINVVCVDAEIKESFAYYREFFAVMN